MRPNIHINFLRFFLFHNYWFCDFEYLKVITKHKSSIFCGNRFPWLYDVSDSSVKIIFSTQRLGSKHYSLELQYHGAYALNFQHCVILAPRLDRRRLDTILPWIKTDLPNLEENKFVSFHFISKFSLELLTVTIVNMCTSNCCHQDVVCYDGPGIKSPILPIKSNVSASHLTCKSSTFQMVCIFSRPSFTCKPSKVPYVRYQTERSHGKRHRHLHRAITYFHLTLALYKNITEGLTDTHICASLQLQLLRSLLG